MPQADLDDSYFTVVLTSEWIPSLVLINIVILCVSHGINFANIIATGEECSAPSVCIVVRCIIVANGPNNTRPT